MLGKYISPPTGSMPIINYMHLSTKSNTQKSYKPQGVNISPFLLTDLLITHLFSDILRLGLMILILNVLLFLFSIPLTLVSVSLTGTTYVLTCHKSWDTLHYLRLNIDNLFMHLEMHETNNMCLLVSSTCSWTTAWLLWKLMCTEGGSLGLFIGFTISQCYYHRACIGGVANLWLKFYQFKNLRHTQQQQ